MDRVPEHPFLQLLCIMQAVDPTIKEVFEGWQQHKPQGKHTFALIRRVLPDTCGTSTKRCTPGHRHTFAPIHPAPPATLVTFTETCIPQRRRAPSSSSSSSSGTLTSPVYESTEGSDIVWGEELQPTQEEIEPCEVWQDSSAEETSDEVSEQHDKFYRPPTPPAKDAYYPPEAYGVHGRDVVFSPIDSPVTISTSPSSPPAGCPCQNCPPGLCSPLYQRKSSPCPSDCSSPHYQPQSPEVYSQAYPLANPPAIQGQVAHSPDYRPQTPPYMPTGKRQRQTGSRRPSILRSHEEYYPYDSNDDN